MSGRRQAAGRHGTLHAGLRLGHPGRQTRNYTDIRQGKGGVGGAATVFISGNLPRDALNFISLSGVLSEVIVRIYKLVSKGVRKVHPCLSCSSWISKA